jgi:aminopeptidase N
MRPRTASSWLIVLLAATGCVADDDGYVDDSGDCVDGKCDDTSASGDIASTKLEVDLAENVAVATIELARNGTVALDVRGLEVKGVRDGRGNRRFRVDDGTLIVTSVYSPMEIEYAFTVHEMADGLLPGGSTVTWPYWCGNLFPCNPAPADGERFELVVEGAPDGMTTIAPREIPADAPAYQIAWATGEYETQLLGTTTAGTEVSVSWLPRGKTKALAGTRHLVAAFDWLETHIGPYQFGREVGSVAVVWGEGMYGGMEHHPFWHVAVDAMDDEGTHVHEAAHGWFGDGVRIRCWEDFVLSEGTVSYLTARAMGQVAGAVAEAAVWAEYEESLDAALAEWNGLATWPGGCDQVDILADGLFSDLPYMQGAFFYKEVAAAVGAEALDATLSRFYLAHRGKAAGMQDMLDAIRADTGFDPTALADRWLRQTR